MAEIVHQQSAARGVRGAGIVPQEGEACAGERLLYAFPEDRKVIGIYADADDAQCLRLGALSEIPVHRRGLSVAHGRDHGGHGASGDGPQTFLKSLGDVNGVQIPLRFWHNVSSDDLVSQSLPFKMARHRASREERPARSPAPCRAHHYVLWLFIIPCEYARGKTCIAICLLLRIQT